MFYLKSECGPERTQDTFEVPSPSTVHSIALTVHTVGRRSSKKVSCVWRWRYVGESKQYRFRTILDKPSQSRCWINYLYTYIETKYVLHCWSRWLLQCGSGQVCVSDFTIFWPPLNMANTFECGLTDRWLNASWAVHLWSDPRATVNHYLLQRRPQRELKRVTAVSPSVSF